MLWTVVESFAVVGKLFHDCALEIIAPLRGVVGSPDHQVSKLDFGHAAVGKVGVHEVLALALHGFGKLGNHEHQFRSFLDLGPLRNQGVLPSLIHKRLDGHAGDSTLVKDSSIFLLEADHRRIVWQAVWLVSDAHEDQLAHEVVAIHNTVNADEVRVRCVHRDFAAKVLVFKVFDGHWKSLQLEMPSTYYSNVDQINALAYNVRSQTSTAQMQIYQTIVDAQIDSALGGVYDNWDQVKTWDSVPTEIVVMASILVAARLELTRFAINEAGMQTPNPYAVSLEKQGLDMLESYRNADRIIPGLLIRFTPVSLAAATGTFDPQGSLRTQGDSDVPFFNPRFDEYLDPRLNQ